MLRRLDLRGSVQDVQSVLPRPAIAGEGPLDEVRAILADVRQRGDIALLEMTSRFDGADLEAIRVNPAEVAAAPDRIQPGVLKALEVAAEAVRRHHVGQAEPPVPLDGGRPALERPADGDGRTFAQMTTAEKNRISHRADAFAKFVKGCFA